MSVELGALIAAVVVGFSNLRVGALMAVVIASGLPMMEWGVLLIGAAYLLHALTALNRRWRSRWSQSLDRSRT